MLRQHNTPEIIKIIVGPEALYASCSRGRTEDVVLTAEMSREDVKALGLMSRSILKQTLLNQEYSTCGN